MTTLRPSRRNTCGPAELPKFTAAYYSCSLCCTCMRSALVSAIHDTQAITPPHLQVQTASEEVANHTAPVCTGQHLLHTPVPLCKLRVEVVLHAQGEPVVTTLLEQKQSYTFISSLARRAAVSWSLIAHVATGSMPSVRAQSVQAALPDHDHDNKNAHISTTQRPPRCSSSDIAQVHKACPSVTIIPCPQKCTSSATYLRLSLIQWLALRHIVADSKCC